MITSSTSTFSTFALQLEIPIEYILALYTFAIVALGFLAGSCFHGVPAMLKSFSKSKIEDEVIKELTKEDPKPEPIQDQDLVADCSHDDSEVDEDIETSPTTVPVPRRRRGRPNQDPNRPRTPEKIRLLQKVRENMGHPRRSDFVRMMKYGNAKPHLI